jgi:hypothetical protein
MTTGMKKAIHALLERDVAPATKNEFGKVIQASLTPQEFAVLTELTVAEVLDSVTIGDLLELPLDE